MLYATYSKTGRTSNAFLASQIIVVYSPTGS